MRADWQEGGFDVWSARTHDWGFATSSKLSKPDTRRVTICYADPNPSGVFEVLAEYDSDTVDVSHTELTNAIRLVGWLRGTLNASADDLAVVSVDILHPLKQVDALRTFFRSDEVNRGVVA